MCLRLNFFFIPQMFINKYDKCSLMSVFQERSWYRQSYWYKVSQPWVSQWVAQRMERVWLNIRVDTGWHQGWPPISVPLEEQIVEAAQWTCYTIADRKYYTVYKAITSTSTTWSGDEALTITIREYGQISSENSYDHDKYEHTTHYSTKSLKNIN